MTSAEPLDATQASPQMEDGNQPTIDEFEYLPSFDHPTSKSLYGAWVGMEFEAHLP
jgi:hypothetical protein